MSITCLKLLPILLMYLKCPVHCFWDLATTTETTPRWDNVPRQSFFRWQRTEFEYLRFWIPYWDWADLTQRRNLNCIAGISIDFICLSTAVLLNRRTLITSANYLDPYILRPKDLRIWALGRAGSHITPYRYRVWRWRRVLPKSLNPEHWHGPRGVHVPRHDVAIIHSMDQIYLYPTFPTRYHYAYKGWLALKTQHIDHILFAGSGYEYLQHVMENYKIFYGLAKREDIVNCEKYLPKWWGKFICIKNTKSYAGIQNGGGMFSNMNLVGLGCFEIRYNEDRIFVFTDLRYYYHWVNVYANFTFMEYYEFAYPQWSVALSGIYDGHTQWPIIPHHQVMTDHWPLGK